jgi:hypothetical protein
MSVHETIGLLSPTNRPLVRLRERFTADEQFFERERERERRMKLQRVDADSYRSSPPWFSELTR